MNRLESLIKWLTQMKIVFPIFIILSLFHLDISATNSPSIHVFGDSHSFELSQVPGCVIHWLGPVTMHRIGRDHFSVLHLPSHGVREGQIAIFAFGEIDVRCHIGKQKDLFNRSMDEIIETLVGRYFDTIWANRALYRDLTCIVYSITPPTNLHFNPEYPFYGTLEDRVCITKKVNKRLSELCASSHLLFLDVYNEYANPDGSLNIALSDGMVHIHSAYNQAIIEKLNQILLKHEVDIYD